MITKNPSPHILKIMLLPALFLLCPFLYAYFFCVPFGDDFDEATKALFFPDLPGALYDTVRNWLSWSGRYSYHFCAVLFGAAIRQPLFLSLANFLPVAVFFTALLKFSPLFTSFPKFLFAILCLLVLYSNFYNLWCFYGYMDSFSTVLQWSAFFIFLLFCMRLYAGMAKDITGCVVSGIFAIGIYEIAALEVFWSCLGFWLADISRSSKACPSASIAEHIQSFLKKSPFYHVQLWICAGIIFSFLSPGNFARASIRYIPLEQKLQQMVTIFPNWLVIIKNFFSGFWFAEIFIVTMLAAIFSSSRIQKETSGKIFLFVLPLALWLLFSFSAAFLLALSDASLTNNSKFSDMISCCLALATAFSLFPLLGTLVQRLDFSCAWTRRLIVLLIILFMTCVFFSHNFKLVAINSANGEIARYSHFVRETEKELSQYAASYTGENSWPDFGIYGELKNFSARSIRVIADKPHVTLDEWQGGAFPIWSAQVFNHNPKSWPNERASWFYNVGSLKADFPNPLKAIETDCHAVAPEKSLPAQLLNSGICEVKLAQAAGFGNRKYLWVLVRSKEKLSSSLQIFIPAQISAQRLLPIPFQQYLYDNISKSSHAEMNLEFNLAGSILGSAMSRSVKDWHAFPVPGYFASPDFIYISINGRDFDKVLFRE